MQERLSQIERDLNAGRAQREDLVRIFENTGSVSGDAGRGPLSQRSLEDEQLIVANAELEQALSIYSETHPRVIRLQGRVDRLKAVVAAQTDAREQDEREEAEARKSEDKLSPEQAILQATLSEIDSRLEFLETDAARTEEDLVELQAAIARSSATGIELSSLERDYENIQARYNAALNNLNAAQMSERIETTAQGQRITEIESANIPRVPTGPNRPKIAIMGAAAGFALAVGYFLLLELLNRCVRRPAELIDRFNVTPIAIIPYLESKSERFWRRSGIAVALLVVVIGVPLGLLYIDTNYIPLELVVQRGFEKLGLS